MITQESGPCSIGLCCPQRCDTAKPALLGAQSKPPSRILGQVLSWVKLWLAHDHRTGHLNTSEPQPGIPGERSRRGSLVGEQGRSYISVPLPSTQSFLSLPTHRVLCVTSERSVGCLQNESYSRISESCFTARWQNKGLQLRDK